MPVSATTNPYRNLAVTVVALGLVLNSGIAVWALLTRPALNTDFMAFWSFPRFAAAGDVMGIYDAAKLQAFQQTLYPGFHSFYPYLYPPTLLLVTGWLRDFSFAAAQMIWTVAGLSALMAAEWFFFPKHRRAFGIAAMLGSPAALLTGATGETAFFTTALLLAGFTALPRFPILAGIAFGLLTLKPQLGVLIPVFLLARGDWRAIGAAAGTGLALVALSCVLFPPALWPEWALTLPAYQADYFSAGGRLNLNIIVTIAANLVTLGAGAKIACAAQTLSSFAVIIAVFFAARRAPYHLAVAALFTGIFLTAPHAYAYDSIILTASLILVAESGVGRGFLAIALVIYLGPLLLLTPISHWFLYAIPEAILFILILRLAFAAVPRDSAAHKPGVTRNA
jgi:hypothetical protein